jgi:ATP synthase protein I
LHEWVKLADPNDSNYGKYLSLGLEMAVGVLLGFGVGWWLDKRFGWTPWGVTIGTLVGSAGGLYLLVREGLRANKD